RAATLRLVGRSTPLSDGAERLAGQARFAADVMPSGALHAHLVLSPHASAHILSVDRSRALAARGVVAVLTARDLSIPGAEDAAERGILLLALDQVRHAGQPVAVVLGEDAAAAYDGADLVEVEYSPAAFEKADTPADVVRFERGDVARGFAEAD